MQENLRLVMWTIAGMAAAWFSVMSINRMLFTRGSTAAGLIAIKETDIGTQCGASVDNVNDSVEYTITKDGKVKYLCPQNIWPIQKMITALTLTPEFRSTLSPIESETVKTRYPEKPLPPPANPFIQQPTMSDGVSGGAAPPPPIPST